MERNNVPDMPKIHESKIFKIVKNTLDNYYKYDVDKNLPYLHRWCNTTSIRYKDTCDWEKKLDDANSDNSYSNKIYFVKNDKIPRDKEKTPINVFLDNYGY